MNSILQTIPTSWSDTLLDEARQQGDAGGRFNPDEHKLQIGMGEADTLAAQVLLSAMSPAQGRKLDYNHLVDLADQMASDAELLLLGDSHLATCFAKYPEGLRGYYCPMPAPSWVDPEKIAIAAKLWTDNSLAMIGVLYASSLPACYLIAKGIPALYRTEKLKDPTYIFQRIYETGMMLDAVMDPGGMRVVHDGPMDDDLSSLLETLKELDPVGAWTMQEKKLVRTQQSTACPELKRENIEAHLRHRQTVHAERRRLKLDPAPGGAGAAGYVLHETKRGFRYLWGPGYLAAKKVRLLHASMRFMLLNPSALMAHVKAVSEPTAGGRLAQNYQGRPGWDSAGMGVPVNQEDLAYTLLTFSLLLPKGLEHWGCEVTVEQKEAFLHLWRIVGHVMGLRDDLMPDTLVAAEDLYRTVTKRQAGASPNGIALTEAVADFLKSYLPPLLGLRDYLPYVLIADLMGEQAKDLLSRESWERVDSFGGQLIREILCHSLRAYFRMYGVLRQFSVTDSLFSSLFHRTSEELVQSWRDEFMRRPFYVPTSLTEWQVVRGVNPAFREELQAWRKRVFLWVFLPIAFLGLSFPLLIGAGILLLFHLWLPSILTGGTGILGILTALWGMESKLPSIFRQRPKPSSIPVRAEN